MRPCTCDNVKGGPWDESQCRLCWHFHNSPHYRQLWEEYRALPDKCPHFGEQIGLRECQGCKGNVQLKTFRCNHPSREPDEIIIPDCSSCLYKPRLPGLKKLTLVNMLSPGDVLVMTAAIYSLQKQHPGKFDIAVRTSCDAIFEHNPDVSPVTDGEEMMMHYPLVHQSNQRAVSFLQGYCDWFEENLNVRVPLLTNRPHLYLSSREKTWMNQVEEVTGKRTPFWIICAGYKKDFVAKWWGHANYQRVVDILKGKVQFVQIGEAHHEHAPLEGVINLVGKTSARQLIRLAYHAQGGVGPVTFLQHLAAAWEKPYVCIAGGREPVAWISYPKQQLIHRIGAFECSQVACWKSRVLPLGDGDKEKDGSLCLKPVGNLPACLESITPEEVVEKVLLNTPIQ